VLMKSYWHESEQGRPSAPPTSASLQVWSPTPEFLQFDREIRRSVAQCLSDAFSHGLWSSAPMPLGSPADRHSATGILAMLGARVSAVLASLPARAPGHFTRGDVVGCVVGAILNERLIDAFELRDHGAMLGDALLAYIGIAPSAQGLKVWESESGDIARQPNVARQHRYRALASVLFSRWLELADNRAAPATYMRTRGAIKSIRHLADKHGFQRCGVTHVDFHGEWQERLIYKRVTRSMD